MKILYHHRTKSRDGQYVHISELQAAFRRRGHDLYEVAPGGRDEVAFGGEARGLSLISKLVPNGMREILEWGYNGVSYLALQRAVHAYDPDVIYERYALGNVAGIMAARRFQLPLLLEVNAPLAEERGRFGGLTFPEAAQKLETFICRQSNQVLAVTEVLKAKLVEAGAPADRVVVIPNGIDPRQFNADQPVLEAKRRLGLDGKIVLGFTGFCRPWHGLDRVVRLMARRDDVLSDAHFLIVGDGPACPGLLDLAKDLDIPDRVSVTGVVPRDRLPAHIAAFDIALQPDVTSYASPLKLFEYMALAKAVVAPNRANIREVVADGVSASLFPPEDEEAMGEAILRLVVDPGLRERLGRGARARIESRPYTWDHNAERIDRIVAEVRGR